MINCPKFNKYFYMRYTKQQKAIINLVKCVSENKMKSAVNYLQEAVDESIKRRIIKCLKKSKK